MRRTSRAMNRECQVPQMTAQPIYLIFVMGFRCPCPAQPRATDHSVFPTRRHPQTWDLKLSTELKASWLRNPEFPFDPLFATSSFDISPVSPRVDICIDYLLNTVLDAGLLVMSKIDKSLPSPMYLGDTYSCSLSQKQNLKKVFDRHLQSRVRAF